MPLHVGALLGMVACYGLILAVGAWASRTRESSRSVADLFLAGRSLPLLLGALTMTATWVGGGYINGTAEAAYASGLVWCQAPWGYALALLIGGLFFAGPMRRRRYTTLLDPFAEAYGSRVGAVLYLPALVGEIFWSAAILVALGTTFGTILGLDHRTSIVLSAAIAVAYTFLGGLWSVAYTDVAQLLLILVGLGCAIPFALDHAGGAALAFGAYGESFGAAASLLPPAEAWGSSGPWAHQGWLWLDVAFLLMLGGIPWGVYFQRVLSCPSPAVARRLSIAAALGCLLLAIPPGVLGVVGATVDWSAAGAPGAPEGALVLPWVLRYLTPPVVAVIGLGAVAAAVMSSVDSSILSVSTMFVWNVYRPLVRPEAADRELLRAARVAILAAGALAVWLALSVRSVYALWLFCSDLVYVLLFPQLVTVLYSRRVTRAGAVAGLVVGLLLRASGGEPLLGVPALLPWPVQHPDQGVLFPFRTASMLASLGTIWLVSRLGPRSGAAAPSPESGAAIERDGLPPGSPVARAQRDAGR